MTEVTVPGVYDLPADVYHSDPVPDGSISSSGAKLLLPPNAPAKFRWTVENGTEHREVFDYGNAAHTLVLGSGPPIREVEADNWRGGAAKLERADAYAAGEVPLLTEDVAHVRGMAAALLKHPLASALFDPASGRPEQSLFWRNPEFETWQRCRLDWLPDPRESGRVIMADYKTTASADPKSCAKSMANYSYNMQAAWNLDLARELGLAGEDASMMFVFQEKTPPYLVTVAECDPEALMWARRKNRKALDIYRECVASGRWPGYADDDVVTMELPTWQVKQLEEAYWLGAYDTKETAT
jgi:hypothetical protein